MQCAKRDTQSIPLNCVDSRELAVAAAPEQRLGHGHLVHQDLRFSQRRFGNPVTGLDNGCFHRARGGRNTRRARKETADIHGVGGFVRPLVDHLQRVAASDDRRRNLQAARSPAIRQGHFPRCKRHLMTRYGHGFQQRATDHAFGLFIEVGEVIAFSHGTFFHARIHAAFSSLGSGCA